MLSLIKILLVKIFRNIHRKYDFQPQTFSARGREAPKHKSVTLYDDIFHQLEVILLQDTIPHQSLAYAFCKTELHSIYNI